MGKANTYLTGKPWMKTLTPGDAYTNLTVIRFVGMREVGQRKRQVYLFRCLCGKEVEFLGTDVYRERIKSCGCTHDLPRGHAAANYRLGSYRQQAKKRGLKFLLSKDEALKMFQQNCHYCNCPPSNISRRHDFNGEFRYNGIDRKDNAQGYTTENCVPCCRVCNWMKQKMSPKEFLAQCKKIVANYEAENV